MSKSRKYTGTGSDKPEAPIGVVKINTTDIADKLAAAEQIPIFEIDDVVYSIPDVQRAEVGIRYLDIAAKRGTQAAAHYLIRETVGEEGLEALMAVKGLAPKDWERISKKASQIVMPKSKGPGPKGSRP
jgi:hypothetical protein